MLVLRHEQERWTKRIVARAERTYADPGALLKLYVHEPESAAMSAWRQQQLARAVGLKVVTPKA
jgi:hypothetical protein